MPLETASYIHQLNAANPLGSDPIASGDDHIRLIKAALKATFPDVTGPVGAVPPGGIILWSGAVSAIPSGWALCDGSNGTPDLRNRFVMGAGGTRAVGSTGGSADSVLPYHTHTVSTVDLNHTHAFGAQTGGQSNTHYHTYTAQGSGGGPLSGYTQQTEGGIFGGIAQATGEPTADHTHRVDGTTGYMNQNVNHTHTVSAEGASTTNANLPPYYALAYIMKV